MSVNYEIALVYGIPVARENDPHDADFYYQFLKDNPRCLLNFEDLGDRMNDDTELVLVFKGFSKKFDFSRMEGDDINVHQISKMKIPSSEVVEARKQIFEKNGLVWTQPDWFFAFNIS